jgi:6-phosphogluconolactonase
VITRDVEVIVLENENEIATVVGKHIAEAAAAGRNIVLTGGKTPQRAYEDAAKQQPDWSEVDVWWGDERCVPPDDANSNYAAAKKSLLDKLERGPRNVHRIKGELGMDAAAAEYDEELGDTQLDLLLLGIGPDSHVASQFPNAPTLRQRKRVLPAKPGWEPYIDRVTLSIPTLRSANEILFIVAGEQKADAVRRAFVDEPSDSAPASLVRARSGRTRAIIDRAAAAGLQG